MLARCRWRVLSLCHVHRNLMNQSNERFKVSECTICICWAHARPMLVCRPQANTNLTMLSISSTLSLAHAAPHDSNRLGGGGEGEKNTRNKPACRGTEKNL